MTTISLVIVGSSKTITTNFDRTTWCYIHFFINFNENPKTTGDKIICLIRSTLKFNKQE